MTACRPASPPGRPCRSARVRAAAGHRHRHAFLSRHRFRLAGQLYRHPVAGRPPRRSVRLADPGQHATRPASSMPIPRRSPASSTAAASPRAAARGRAAQPALLAAGDDQRHPARGARAPGGGSGVRRRRRDRRHRQPGPAAQSRIVRAVTTVNAADDRAAGGAWRSQALTAFPSRSRSPRTARSRWRCWTASACGCARSIGRLSIRSIPAGLGAAGPSLSPHPQPRKRGARPAAAGGRLDAVRRRSGAPDPARRGRGRRSCGRRGCRDRARAGARRPLRLLHGRLRPRASRPIGSSSPTTGTSPIALRRAVICPNLVARAGSQRNGMPLWR